MSDKIQVYIVEAWAFLWGRFVPCMFNQIKIIKK